MDSPQRKLDTSKCTMYFCAALTAPSSMTAHMQAGDILVSINGVSLISLINESDHLELKGGSDAFFDVIKAAIKHAKSPRKVRLLRPLRVKSPTPSLKQAVFDINISEHESSLLFDSNFKTHIPKFSVGKLPIGKLFEPVTASLFDVIFPFQRSLGIRIFPYKLTNTNAIPKKIESRKVKSDDHENNLLEDMLEDDSLEGIHDTTGEYDFETKEEDVESMDSEIMASVGDFLIRLDSDLDLMGTACESQDESIPSYLPSLMGSEKTPERLKSVKSERSILNEKIEKIEYKLKEGGRGGHDALLRLGNLNDDDIVSDRGRMPVGVHVSRLEADGDDFIPVSSPTCGQMNISHVEVEEDEVLPAILSPSKSNKAVGNMVAKFETSNKSQSSSQPVSHLSSFSLSSSRIETPLISPIRRVVVTLDDLSTAETSPRKSGPEGPETGTFSPPNLSPKNGVSAQSSNIKTLVASYENSPTAPSPVPSVRSSVPSSAISSVSNSALNSVRSSVMSNSSISIDIDMKETMKEIEREIEREKESVKETRNSPKYSGKGQDKETVKLTRSLAKAISPIREISPIQHQNREEPLAFPGLMSKLTDLMENPEKPDPLNDSTTQRIVSKAVEKIQVNLKSVTSENQQLKAKMDFYKKSVSIEKQLLTFELKGIKAKLESSENELEEAMIESKMNQISLQDELEHNMTNVVALILAEKEILTSELQKAKIKILEIEGQLNKKYIKTIEENEKMKLDLDLKIEENILLTADILNLQAERDCLKSSNTMTEFRHKTAVKVQLKEIERLKVVDKKTKTRVMSFIQDFDATVPRNADQSEETIESFLNGRGLAINKKRRKVFAALQADNTRLYDDLDVLQELLEVEAALHVTRVELYAKTVVEKGVLAVATPSPIETPLGRRRSSCVNLLINEESTSDKIYGRSSSGKFDKKTEKSVEKLPVKSIEKSTVKSPEKKLLLPDKGWDKGGNIKGRIIDLNRRMSETGGASVLPSPRPPIVTGAVNVQEKQEKVSTLVIGDSTETSKQDKADAPYGNNNTTDNNNNANPILSPVINTSSIGSNNSSNDSSRSNSYSNFLNSNNNYKNLTTAPSTSTTTTSTPTTLVTPLNTKKHISTINVDTTSPTDYGELVLDSPFSVTQGSTDKNDNKYDYKNDIKIDTRSSSKANSMKSPVSPINVTGPTRVGSGLGSIEKNKENRENKEGDKRDSRNINSVEESPKSSAYLALSGTTSPDKSSDLSPSSLGRSPSVTSPTLMSITPRKKCFQGTPKVDKYDVNSMKTEFRSSGSKTPVGFVSGVGLGGLGGLGSASKDSGRSSKNVSEKRPSEKRVSITVADILI